MLRRDIFTGLLTKAAADPAGATNCLAALLALNLERAAQSTGGMEIVTIAEQIARIAGTLPESLAREVLDFVCFLQARERGELNEWQNAQTVALAHVWDNADDEVWNDVPFR